MGYSDEYKLVHIHIPRTAGVAIQNALKTNLHSDKHYTANELKQLEPEKWEKYTKLVIVRNPWMRLYSFYKKQYGTWITKTPRGKQIGFSEWVVDCLENGLHRDAQIHGKNVHSYYLSSQCVWFCGADSIVGTDYLAEYRAADWLIWKFEWLKVLYQTAIEKRGWPKLIVRNASRATSYSDMMEQYSDRALKLLAPRFETDVRLFDYVYGKEC